MAKFNVSYTFFEKGMSFTRMALPTLRAQGTNCSALMVGCVWQVLMIKSVTNITVHMEFEILVGTCAKLQT